jgi:pantoate--beta-alanine ligase
MQIIRSLAEFRKIRQNLSSNSIGFVPTMGNLHAGHQSLLEYSVANNDLSILSIYVNPTQFNNKADLKNYPRTIEEDCALAKKLRVDYILIPQYEEIYSDNYAFRISENTELSKILEGKCRSGHFTGMLTIVAKLLLITKPTKAYFGEKDYQQYLLVKEMSESFFLDTQIIALPTKRDNNGLALSSRNNLLSTAQLQQAPLFPRLLSSAKLSEKEISQLLTKEGFIVDYIKTYKNRRFGAVKLGKVRLIDNFEK